MEGQLEHAVERVPSSPEGDHPASHLSHPSSSQQPEGRSSSNETKGDHRGPVGSTMQNLPSGSAGAGDAGDAGEPSPSPPVGATPPRAQHSPAATGPNEGDLLHAYNSAYNSSYNSAHDSAHDSGSEGQGSKEQKTKSTKKKQKKKSESSSVSSGSSGSATLAEGVHREASQPSFHDAPEHPASARGPRDNTASDQCRPTSYLFQDPDAAATPFPIPEMQKLTEDVPASDQISIILGPLIIILGDLIIPCIVYYVWLGAQGPHGPRYDHDILGLAIIPFGLGELYILVVRVWRLVRYYDQCAPLLSRHKWELDATSWIYTAALLAGLVPFIIGSERTIPELYLYSPGLYMAFLFFWTLISLVPFKTPVRIDSEPRGTRMRPIVYYAAEDFFAVDGWQKRDFRERYRQRYETSIMFQKMIFELTVWWCAGFMVYLGCLSAVIWNLPFEIAFGLSLGVLFSWIITWSVLTYIYIQLALEREREWWIKKKTGSEKV